jgi:SAM-dependent methyltransferase
MQKTARVSFASRAAEILKMRLSWLIATGQTVRWATEQLVLRELLSRFSVVASADIGCGGGHYLLDLLLSVSSTAVGIEPDLRSVGIAYHRIQKRGLASRVEVRHGAAEAIPLEGGSVDFVLCTQVLEHVQDVACAVREICRILRPRGHALLSIPIPPDPTPSTAHLHADFGPASLDRALSEAGFTVLERRKCMYFSTRAVVWLIDAVPLPLPLVPVCRFEQALSRYVKLPHPYTYICLAQRP